MRVEMNHYFGLSLQGGYARSHPFVSDVDPLHGVAGGAHLLYEFQRDHFIMNIGAGFVWQQTGWRMPGVVSLPDQPMVDTQGTPFILKTSVTRQDELRRGYIDIPLLFGGEWGIGYLMGGVKVGIGLIDKSRQKGAVTTAGVYDQYFVPIHDAANHAYYTDQAIRRHYTAPSSYDVRASIEGGIVVAQVPTRANATVKVRLGAYLDYGFFTATVAARPDPLIHTGSHLDLNTYLMQPILKSGSHLLDNLMAGVKLTVLIGAPGGAHECIGCRIWDDRWRPIRAKKRCITCERGYTSN